jgi:hypothetical protein
MKMLGSLSRPGKGWILGLTVGKYGKTIVESFAV